MEALAVSTVLFGLTTKSPDKWHFSYFITTVTLIVRILGTNRSPKSVEALAVSTVLFGLTTKSPDKWHSCMLLDETLLRSAGVFLLCEPG